MVNTYHRKDGSKIVYNKIAGYKLISPDGNTVLSGIPNAIYPQLIATAKGIFFEADFIVSGWQVIKLYA